VQATETQVSRYMQELCSYRVPNVSLEAGPSRSLRPPDRQRALGYELSRRRQGGTGACAHPTEKVVVLAVVCV
jgi:hypothetical protein